MGSGTFGIVFLCKYEVNTIQRISISVAVKILFNFGINKSNNKNQFQVEYENLKLLPPHKHIVQLVAAFVARPTEEMINHFHESTRDLIYKKNPYTGEISIRSTQFVIMECHPWTMCDYIEMKGSQISIKERLKFCEEIAIGLEFLWQHNLCHRDMKLSNLLISSDNSVVICDFGLSTQVDQNGRSRVSEAGGNPAHLAPEIQNEFKIQEVQSPSNILVNYSKQPQWELGTLCFEATVGEHPFGDYPIGFQNPPNLSVGKPKFDKESLVKDVGLPKRFVNIVYNLVSNDQTLRASLQDARVELSKCHHEKN